MARWYLVQTKAGGEAVANLNLKRQGYETFLPLVVRAVRHARKLREAAFGLFPGYLFVALDLEAARWRPINGTLGVVRIVTASERPLAAPTGLVETLMGRADAAGCVRLSADLAPGDHVRVIRGPFADQLGRVERLQPQERVRVLLSIMHGVAPVELALDACARADIRELEPA